MWRADSFFREEHHYLFAVHGQRRGNFPADESAADHGEPTALLRKRSKLPVVRQRAVIDDRAIIERKPARRRPRGEKKLLEGVNAPLVVRHPLISRIDGLGPVDPDEE